MITKTAIELSEETIKQLNNTYSRNSLNNMDRQVEAVKTVGAGVGGLLGGLGGSIGHKLLTANPAFATPTGKVIGTLGAVAAPVIGASIGTGIGSTLGGSAITNAIRNVRFHTENGRKLLPEKYKDNDLAALSANSAVKGGLVGAGGYTTAKGLYRLATHRPMVNPIMPKTLLGATGIGVGVGLGSALLNKALQTYSTSAKEKYKV